jgi:poly(3-hydroxybutyrate) depolymerase
MKTTRNTDQGYTVSGYTKADQLVQYTITKNGHGWSTDLVYGQGTEFNQLFSTKAEAVQAIINQ